MPDTNVKYAEAIMNEMRAQGHIVRMKFTTRRETLKNIEKIIIWCGAGLGGPKTLKKLHFKNF